MAQLGLFKITYNIERVAIYQGKDRLACGGVIPHTGRQARDPSIHRSFDHGLGQLPLGLFQRCLCNLQAGLHGFYIDIGGIEIFRRDVIPRQMSATFGFVIGFCQI